MAREDMIRKDMELVGTYNEIFEPTIKHLAKTERELSRAEKEWKKQGARPDADRPEQGQVEAPADRDREQQD